jgi:hypothetical protein
MEAATLALYLLAGFYLLGSIVLIIWLRKEAP